MSLAVHMRLYLNSRYRLMWLLCHVIQRIKKFIKKKMEKIKLVNKQRPQTNFWAKVNQNCNNLCYMVFSLFFWDLSFFSKHPKPHWCDRIMPWLDYWIECRRVCWCGGLVTAVLLIFNIIAGILLVT